MAERLSEAELHELATKARAGDIAARNRIVERNYGLVFWHTKQFMSRYGDGGLSRDDIVGSSSLGLIKAAETYEPEKGEFTTHARWNMFGATMREIQNAGRSIRIPASRQAQFRRFKEAAAALEAELMRKPTDRELAKRMKLSVEDIQEFLMMMQVGTIGLDDLGRSEEGDDYLEDRIAALGDDSCNPEQRIIARDEYEGVRRELRQFVGVLDSLPITDQNRSIFKRRYGLHDGRLRLTQFDVFVKELGVSRPAVDQRIKKVWRRLRGYRNHRRELPYRRHEAWFLEQVKVLRYTAEIIGEEFKI